MQLWPRPALLKEIQGRSTDFVIAADGTVMHGLALIYILRDLPEVNAFKIIQESLEEVLVQVVPLENFNTEVEAKIIKGLKSRLGQSVNIRVERLAEIPAEPSGKHRYVKCLIENRT
jgi:phenylacetate-CoA ligase